MSHSLAMPESISVFKQTDTRYPYLSNMETNDIWIVAYIASAAVLYVGKKLSAPLHVSWIGCLTLKVTFVKKDYLQVHEGY